MFQIPKWLRIGTRLPHHLSYRVNTIVYERYFILFYQLSSKIQGKIGKNVDFFEKNFQGAYFNVKKIPENGNSAPKDGKISL